MKPGALFVTIVGGQNARPSLQNLAYSELNTDFESNVLQIGEQLDCVRELVSICFKYACESKGSTSL
jgi:hypothetical protein